MLNIKMALLDKIIPDLIPNIIHYYRWCSIDIKFLIGLRNLSTVWNDGRPHVESYLERNKKTIRKHCVKQHSQNNCIDIRCYYCKSTNGKYDMVYFTNSCCCAVCS